MKTTRYFEEQVIRKRPYLQLNWISDAIADPLRREIQVDGRFRCWKQVTDIRGQNRYLRVIVLEDGLTVHNAFFDRDFRE